MKIMFPIIAVVALSTALTTNAADVQENWKTHCAKCHGEDGKAATKMGKKAGAKDFTDANVQGSFKDDKAFKSIKEGMKDGDKTLMQPYAEKLSDEEIKALVARVRSFKK